MDTPFGRVLSTDGSGNTSYGFTGEWTDSYIKLIYLRSRYYAPETGRFTTRDTWQGDYTRPLSLNRWNYVEGNPVNYSDPSGNFRLIPCSTGKDGGWKDSDIEKRVNEAEKHMSNDPTDPVNTYVAAGIAIQCAGTDFPREWNYSGVGIAQVSNKQRETPYGEPFYSYKLSLTFCDGKFQFYKILLRGYGLRIKDPNTGELEPMRDPYDPKWAVEYMHRRIQLVLDECGGKGGNEECTPMDTYIAAALAQNGPGFTHLQMKKIGLLKPPENRETYGINKNWFGHFAANVEVNTKTQLHRFNLVINELRSRGWYIPAEIETYKNTFEKLR